MIHVGVRNERMRDAQEFARGQRRHVAEVEQQCPAAETEIDEQRRIRKGIVDEPRLHEPSHVVPLLVRSAQTCRRVRHRASQRPWGGTFYTLFDGRADAENAAAAPRGYFVYIRRSPSSFRTPLAGLGKFDDSLGDLYASRLSHAAAAIGHVHGTNDVDAAFAVRPTLRSAECLTECSAAPRADDPSGRPQPGKPTANVITATTSAPKPKRSNLHRSSRA